MKEHVKSRCGDMAPDPAVLWIGVETSTCASRSSNVPPEVRLCLSATY